MLRSCLLWVFGFVWSFSSVLAQQDSSSGGVLPVGKDGKPLNLDFETGTLKDWTATGTAFDKQPMKGDTIFARRNDMKSEHRGDFWVGSYEVGGDAPTGTLTSAPFKVTHPFASFLIGGGSWEETRVELVDAATQKVIFKASAYDNENMTPVWVDLQKHQGKEIFIRLVDNETGGWGHINFDDFKFYKEKPAKAVAAIGDGANKASAPQKAGDLMKFAGLPPEQAAKEMILPDGFHATLFAGEPDVKQPIAFAIDDRGRLWVAEAYAYPVRQPEGQGKDRILVFEDTNGDGKFDKRTVFIEGLNLVSGMEVGFGGVWVGAAPYLMFIPIDENGGSPKPASAPQILLDGFGYGDTHETLNTFTWGPDGWLYGCHGVFTYSNVGKPGTPKADRTPINAGIWRFHPTKKIFEVFAEGTSNPWGIDFDEHGQCIIEACVIPHLWHIIQGARYERQGGQHFNPYIFDDIKTIADHLHYRGNQWNDKDRASSDNLGGGHAHAGLMIYQGDNWPAEYRGKVFMNNIHGSRINMDVLEASGSGFVGHHGKDFMVANDSWSQIVNLQTGPDGAVYLNDWYDKQQCHDPNPNVHDRSNGRIFKISYGQMKSPQVDLAKLSDDELVKLLTHKNAWFARHAQRILQERGHAPTVELVTLLKNPNETVRLRALWTLHALGQLAPNLRFPDFKDSGDFVRAWIVQLLCEDKRPSEYALKEFLELARTDPSPVVRLYLASALQRIEPEKRWDILEALAAHAEDAKDHNLPLMIWYAAEPLCAADSNRALDLVTKTQIPVVRKFITRRLASMRK